MQIICFKSASSACAFILRLFQSNSSKFSPIALSDATAASLLTLITWPQRPIRKQNIRTSGKASVCKPRVCPPRFLPRAPPPNYLSFGGCAQAPMPQILRLTGFIFCTWPTELRSTVHQLRKVMEGVKSERLTLILLSSEILLFISSKVNLFLLALEDN